MLVNVSSRKTPNTAESGQSVHLVSRISRRSVGKGSADTGRMVGQPEVRNSGLDSRCPKTGGSSLVSVRSSSTFTGESKAVLTNWRLFMLLSLLHKSADCGSTQQLRTA